MIDQDATLYEITEKNPETIPVFSSNGFPHMADPAKRSSIGKTISLKTALLLKQINPEAFVRLWKSRSVEPGRIGTSSGTVR